MYLVQDARHQYPMTLNASQTKRVSLFSSFHTYNIYNKYLLLMTTSSKVVEYKGTLHYIEDQPRQIIVTGSLTTARSASAVAGGQTMNTVQK